MSRRSCFSAESRTGANVCSLVVSAVCRRFRRSSETGPKATLAEMSCDRIQSTFSIRVMPSMDVLWQRPDSSAMQMTGDIRASADGARLGLASRASLELIAPCLSMSLQVDSTRKRLSNTRPFLRMASLFTIAIVSLTCFLHMLVFLICDAAVVTLAAFSKMPVSR
jgi:hypothetical protein